MHFKLNYVDIVFTNLQSSCILNTINILNKNHEVNIMDVGALSMSMAQNKLATDVGVAVLKLAKDTVEQSSEGLVNMINSVPGVGENIDIKL